MITCEFRAVQVSSIENALNKLIIEGWVLGEIEYEKDHDGNELYTYKLTRKI